MASLMMRPSLGLSGVRYACLLFACRLCCSLPLPHSDANLYGGNRQAEHYGYGHMTYNTTHLRFRYMYSDDDAVHQVGRDRIRLFERSICFSPLC
jgi:hypothetical protein